MNKRIYYVVFILLSLILAACNEPKEIKPIDTQNAFNKLNEEIRPSNNRFEQNGIIITLVGFDENTDTLVVGLLELNKETEKIFKKIFFEEISKKNVKLKLVQSDRAVAQ